MYPVFLNQKDEALSGGSSSSPMLRLKSIVQSPVNDVDVVPSVGSYLIFGTVFSMQHASRVLNLSEWLSKDKISDPLTTNAAFVEAMALSSIVVPILG